MRVTAVYPFNWCKKYRLISFKGELRTVYAVDVKYAWLPFWLPTRNFSHDLDAVLNKLEKKLGRLIP
jgi:hypothetical protein